MLQANDFVLVQAQAVIYTPGLAFNPTRILAELLAEYADVFDGDPVAIPLPEDAPLNIARIILKSRIHKLQLHIAPAQLDIFQASASFDAMPPLQGFLE